MTRQKRALAVHDISCVGRCSLTVALPILSAAGFETSVLPTAVLSTHTGGFTGYTYRDLTQDIIPIADHWQRLGLRFDAIYTGYLGSFEQLGLIRALFDRFRSKDTLVLVDPVMADNGVMYRGFSSDFPEGMRALCAQADVIVPNITEAALMLGEDYRPGPYTPEYIRELLKKLSSIGAARIVLTGVFFDDKSLGAASYDVAADRIDYRFADRIEGHFHGTGDVFGSALLAALLHGLPLAEATRTAVDYAQRSIALTVEAEQEVRYGVCFERALPLLMERLGVVAYGS